MSKLQISTFALAALCFAVWLVAQAITVPVDQTYALLAATIFFVIGFGSLVVGYAKAVAPEWNDDNG